MHSISRENQWILTKPAKIYLWEMKKNSLDFGDLDSKIVEDASSALYIQKEINKFLSNLHRYITGECKKSG